MSSRKPFVPPKYSNFGKSNKDLFKKKFDYDNVFKSINKTKHGVTVEVGSNLTNNYCGFIKPKYLKGNYEFESEVYTCPKAETKATLKCKNVMYKGLNLTFGGSSADKQLNNSYGASLDFEYSQEYFTTQVVARSDLAKTKIDASAVVGLEGVAVGGQVVVNAQSGAEVVDANVGAEYTKDDFTLSAYTEKNLDLVNAGFHYKVNSATSIGALFKFDMSGKTPRTLTTAVEHQLDRDTLVKAKADLPSGIVGIAYEQKLASPKVSVQVAAQINTAKAFNAEKFGLGLSFGDF